MQLLVIESSTATRLYTPPTPKWESAAAWLDSAPDQLQRNAVTLLSPSEVEGYDASDKGTQKNRHGAPDETSQEAKGLSENHPRSNSENQPWNENEGRYTENKSENDDPWRKKRENEQARYRHIIDPSFNHDTCDSTLFPKKIVTSLASC